MKQAGHPGDIGVRKGVDDRHPETSGASTGYAYVADPRIQAGPFE
eukprot:CAMPEP_0117505762 /NCGR_PEP_ID=MMETSP0784-20121206/25550_1 /TAXON_ID=39447 /ORGANISM="" /LENGTH=44 /DNA_ID= /DNA_START= /DNA_END= /DNA_ORIENTATION=